MKLKAIACCAMCVALIALPRYSNAQTVGHRTFQFSVQFRTADGDLGSGPVTLQKGRVLTAVHRTDKRKVFQPIVLCDSVRINFSPGVVEDGGDRFLVSGWVPIKGFCPTYGVPVAPGDVFLKLTNFYNTEVRARGCSAAVMSRVRSQPHRAYTSVFACPNMAESECIRFLDQKEVFQTSGRNVQWYLDEGLCLMRDSFVGSTREWSLHCDSATIVAQ